MRETPSSEHAEGLSAREGEAPSSNDLEAIRQLLLGPETKQLGLLRERIEDPELHAEDVSQVLSRAVRIANQRDGRLAAALTPAVESALQSSVKRDPSPLINAIFPIIGPAIRKSISEAFSRLVQSLNSTLEYSLSGRGLRWRVEALRSGRSFAEVVLAHTLLYRVEQLFLIHKPTGLLLRHVRAPHIRAEDASLVSGMLTAIQDFAHDSFRTPAGEALHTLEIGELNVWVESSPVATLAAVIRGRAPLEFRTVLQTALENIHQEQGTALQLFQGDATPFEQAHSHLESCLLAQFTETHRRTSFVPVKIATGLLVILLAVWLAFTFQERRHWTNFLDHLRTEPGIVLTETGRRSGKFFLGGLRDPMAVEPAHLLSRFKLKPEDVVTRWEPYQALNPDMVLRRAVLLLQPPPGVQLRFHGGVLSAEGQAPQTWIDWLRQRAVFLPGIESLNDARLTDSSQASLGVLQQEIEQTNLRFDQGVQLAPGQESTLERLAASLKEFNLRASRTGRIPRITVIGHTDKSGREDFNLSLSRQRAELIANLLIARGVGAGSLLPLGVGARDATSSTASDRDSSPDRRVTFRAGIGDVPGRMEP